MRSGSSQHEDSAETVAKAVSKAGDQQQESGRAGNVREEGVKYFKQKACPLLTGWWEGTAAFSAIFLLPLIAVVPCSTTAVRHDDKEYSV
jgi:hypothetical protein